MPALSVSPCRFPLSWGLAVVGCAVLMGCAHTVKKPVPLATLTAPLPDADYRIQLGDKLDVKFLYSPELNESVTVRPDGLISIPLAHDVRAAGRTPAELTASLRASLSRELRDPQVTVMVRSFSSHVVYVSGEVGKPALLELRGGAHGPSGDRSGRRVSSVGLEAGRHSHSAGPGRKPHGDHPALGGRAQRDRPGS